MDKVIYVVKGLLDCGQSVMKGLKEVEQYYSPIRVSNLYSHLVTNVLEICNTSDFEMRDVHVKIIGSVKNDCFWSSPYNKGDKELYIPCLKPNQRIEVDMEYIDSEKVLVDLLFIWKSMFGIESSQTLQVPLQFECL